MTGSNPNQVEKPSIETEAGDSGKRSAMLSSILSKIRSKNSGSDNISGIPSKTTSTGSTNTNKSTMLKESDLEKPVVGMEYTKRVEAHTKNIQVGSVEMTI